MKKYLLLLISPFILIVGLSLIFREPPAKGQSPKNNIYIDSTINNVNIDTVWKSLYKNVKEIKKERLQDRVIIANLKKVNNNLIEYNKDLKKEVKELKNNEIPIIIDTVYIPVHDTVKTTKNFWGKEKIKN